MGLDFVAMGFELANNDLGSACAVGMVRIRDGVMVDRYSTFINYPRSLGGFDAFNTNMHGITPKDLIGAPVWEEVLPKIIDFVGSDYVVAHNADFDMSVMKHASEVADVQLPNISSFCSRKLSKRAVPGLDKYDLPSMAEALSLGDFSQHDTEGNALIAGMICVELAARNEVGTLVNLMVRHGIREATMGHGREYMVDLAAATPEEPAAVPEPAVVAAPAPVIPVEAPVEVVPAVEPEKATHGSASTSLELKGQRISFVGGFELEERAAAKEAIAGAGGKYLKNVRTDTTLLVIGTHHNPNLEGIVVARAFNEQGSNITFMNKDDFLPMLFASK